jgi:hypothetical protein
VVLPAIGFLLSFSPKCWSVRLEIAPGTVASIARYRLFGLILVFETSPSFRLILNWEKLEFDLEKELCHTARGIIYDPP